MFIDPGFTQKEFPAAPRGWQPEPRNRSFEYDSLSTNYSEFLISEILPHVRKQYKITDDPEGRAKQRGGRSVFLFRVHCRSVGRRNCTRSR